MIDFVVGATFTQTSYFQCLHCAYACSHYVLMGQLRIKAQLFSNNA
jgi:hypothetical protein